MEIIMYCPSCKREIPHTKFRDQDWFFCKRCSSLFFSHESLRENWPSIYRAIKSHGNRRKTSTAS